MPDESSAVLTIDLGAIAANYRLLQQMAEPALCGAAVKADAYGLGAAMVVPMLHRAGCRHFFVATMEEGLAIKPLLPTATVYVMNGLPPGAAREMAGADLVPVLNTLPQIEEWRKYCADRQPRPAVLQIDTGLARLGLSHGEMLRLIGDPRLLQGLPVAMVMTHLACADDPEHPLNRRQLALFCELCQALRFGGTPPLFSIAASSGIFLGSDFHQDLVRPGAALYGVAPTASAANPMRAVVRLQGKILQIRDVDLGMTVGYGATHKFQRPSRVATIGAGYADGIPRALGNKGAVYIDGKRSPLVGRVSMDLITVDIGHLPPQACQVGQAVDIIGPQQPIDDLARDAGTIGYEVLTSLGSRYKRRYLANPA